MAADAGNAGSPTVSVGDRKTSHVIAQFRLRVIVGPDVGASFETRGERTVLGSHESADLVLTDPTVSRFHCELVVEEGRVLVRDLGSRNGTLIDGVTVLAGYLTPGCVITVGRTQIHVEAGENVVRLQLSDRQRFGGLVGSSRAMSALFATLERAAACDSTVLLQGETGTGKDVAAGSIHQESARRDGPFVVVDCGSIAPNLIESELFGHVRGSFTGATTDHAGALEAANGGTLFLDEIGEIPIDLQPKLLRVLERREVKRIGGTEVCSVDVRIIAATNRNLRAEVNAGRFRADLYYRLAVLDIQLPPLRERDEDLAVLVGHMLELLGATDDPRAAPLRSPELLATLAQHPWPGNVRELR
ncbi:MAG TPA: sigma 54-interacting transcriptional regulator, partial [Kofleriaceae bacterium]|nr:sigma 54-interacting transcriptional regulator [Kofleriaceae bacterium]